MFHIFGFQVAAHTHRVDHPHHDTADEQRERHHAQAFQMLSDDLDQQQRRYRRADECYQGQRDGVSQQGAIAALSLGGKVRKNSRMRPVKSTTSAIMAPSWITDRIHLPVRAGQVDV